MHLNDFGRIADTHWKSLPDHFPHVRLDNHVVMPDHIHGIIDIVDGGYSAERRPLPDGQNPAGPRFTAAGNDTEPDDPEWPRFTAAGNDPEPDDPERPRFSAAGNDPEPRPTHTDSRETQDTSRPGPPRPETGSLGMIIGAYKSGVTREINRLRSSPGAAVWQYRFHERIIRTDAAHERIRRYIENNPARWTIDHPYG